MSPTPIVSTPPPLFSSLRLTIGPPQASGRAQASADERAPIAPLAARPGAAALARQHIAHGDQALEQDDELAALAQLEAALALDPLDLSLHQRFWALKRDFAGGRPQT